ncbi:aspartate aminotransferase, partial [Aureobasidium melanogenum]
ELVVAQSFSKNFGLYGQRVGAFHIVAADQDAKDKALSNLIHLQRAEISNPPVYGARIVAFILRNEELKREWEQDLLIMSGRIKAMRAALYGELQALQTPGNWEHIVNQNGMFSYTGLSEKQVLALRKEHIYLLTSGRASISGLNSENVKMVAQAIDKVVRESGDAPAPAA